jgi:predicted acyltransferase (DUF342 family)
MNVINDSILNKRLLVSGDVSLNQRLYVNGDVSFNKNLQIFGTTIQNGDVSMNQRLFIGGDVSLNQRLSVVGDVLFNNKLIVNDDVSFNNKLMVSGDVSFNNKLTVVGDVSFNNKLLVGGDVSFNGNVTINGDNLYLNNKNLTLTTMNVINDSILNKRLLVSGDVSLNQRLYVKDDVSFNKNLQIFGTTIQNGDVSMNQRLFIGGDVSLNQRLFIGGDVSFNKNIGILGTAFFANDVSFNQRVSVGGDVSFNKNIGILGTAFFANDVLFNQRLFIGGDVSFNKNIGILGSANFANDVSLYSRLFIGNDVSMNQRLSVGGDVLMNRRLYVAEDVSFNNRLYVFQDALFNSRLFANNINLSTTNNIFSMTALTGNTNFVGSQSFANPNFNIYFSPNSFFNNNIDNNTFSNNIHNSLDFYVDNPRNNFLLGQYKSDSSISNIYKNNTTYGASYGQTNVNFQNNLAISSNALSNINPINDSTNNIAVGYNSLTYLNGGHCNTSIGSFSMVNLGWSSAGSTFFTLPGNYSLGNNINPTANSTNFNTSIGYFSMSSKNINTSSNKNTVLGALAFADTNVSDINATVSNGIYTQNTFIGYNAQPINGVYSNQIVLGTTSESTYIPGKLVVLKDASLNGNLFVKGDLSFNGRITFSKTAFSTGSIPLLAISDLASSVNAAVAGSASGIISSIQATNVVPTIMPLDSKYNFGENYKEIYDTENIWTNLDMSLTGEYQTALDISGNIFYSNNYGEKWEKATVNFPTTIVTTKDSEVIYISSTNYATSGLFYGIALSMIYSGQTQIASINLRDVADPGEDMQSYIFLSCDYGVTWNNVFQVEPKTTQVSNLATSSDGTYMYAAVYGNNKYLYSTNFGVSWNCPTTNDIRTEGNWKCVATSSSGLYVCFGGDGMGLYLSKNSGAVMTIELSNKYVNSVSMSYSGQYIIVASGNFTPQTPYGTIGSGANNSKNNEPLYFSSNFGTDFIALTGVDAPPTAIWLIVKISGNGQYIIAVTQSDNDFDPGLPGTIWYSYNFGQTWKYNSLSGSRFWTGAAISSTGQYLTFVSPKYNIITSFSPQFNGSYSNTLSTNNMNISGLLNITGTSAPISLIDGSVLTTANSPLDYANNFGTNWNIYAASNSYKFIAMSLTGQYQSAVSINYVTTYGNIFISNNYGINWYNPTIYISTNSGNTYNNNIGLGWQNISVSGSGQYQYAVPVDTSSYIYSKYIYSSSNYGNSWFVSNNNNLVWTCISCSSDGQYIIAGTKLNFLFLSSSYGINWNNTCNNINISSPSNKYWNSVSISSSGQYIYAASLSTGSTPSDTNRDTIYISNNFGTSWISIENSSSNNYWQSIRCSSDGQYVYACSSFCNSLDQIYDGIYVSKNYGNEFDKTNATTNTGWTSISCSSSGKYVIAVSQTYTNISPNKFNGYIYVSIDFGNTWSSSSGTTWSSVSTRSLFNGCAISSDGMYLTACSSTNIYNSVTPYSYIGVSNNFYSYGNNLMVGDVSMNSRLSVLSDVSFNRNFEVLGKSIMRGDVSMNTNLSIGRDVSIYGRLNVNSYNANTIITTSTTNFTMIIAEDMSLNGRLLVTNDVSINQRLYVTGSASILGNVGIGTATPGATLDVNGTIRANGKVAINSSVSSNWTWPLTIIANTVDAIGGNLICNSSAGSNGLDDFQSKAPFVIWDNNYSTGIGLKMGIWRDTGSAYIQCEGANTGAKNICMQPYEGNVGIGTTVPAYKLDVNGNLRVTGTVIVKDLVDGNGYLRFTTDSKINYIQSGLNSSAGSSAPLYFTSMYNSSVWMIINGTGNVGIGTTNPQAKLDIVITNPITSTTLTPTTIKNSAIRIGSTGDAVDGMFIGVFDNNGAVATPGNNGTGFIQNTWDRGATTALWKDIALNPMGGNVGIGVAAPQYNLHVAGSFGVGGSTSLNTLTVTSTTTLNNTVKIYEATRTGYSSDSGTLILEHGNAGGLSAIIFKSKGLNDVGDMGYITYQDHTVTDGYTAGELGLLCIGVENDYGSDHVILQKNGGYVGIGTTSPAFTLDVKGTIRATGQITGNSFNAASDQRIKTNINDISGKFSLDTLRNINPVSYQFIDDSKQKSSMGFIAQQIQNTLENSVSKQTRYIPSIYENINIDNKNITLNNKFTSDISLCDYPIKLQFKDLSNNTLYGTIDKIIDSKTFTLIDPLDTSLNKLFLYGQEVDDFLSINYDSIFTVVTGAVKQLDAELQETKQIVKDQADTIDEMRTELSELKTQMSNIIRYLNNK